MSGSGGGEPQWITVVDRPTNCGEIVVRTNLASPVEKVVVHLFVGAELDVMLEREAVQYVIALFEGNVAGSIVGRIRDLIGCLQRGYAFRAVVLAVDDGIVEVEVKSA